MDKEFIYTLEDKKIMRENVNKKFIIMQMSLDIGGT